MPSFQNEQIILKRIMTIPIPIQNQRESSYSWTRNSLPAGIT